MSNVVLDRGGAEEEIVARLMADGRGPEFNRLLGYRSRPLSRSVIERLKEEVAHLIRVDIHQAVKVAEIARRAAAFCSDPVGLALAHHAYAMAMHFSGRYTEALDHYDQAQIIYSRLGKEVEAARIARAKVDALMYLGRYEEALKVAAFAREIFQRCNQTILLAQVEMNVGNIFHRLDRYREALQFYEQAEEIFAAAHDEFGLAHARFNRANQYTQLNDFEKALECYEQARQGYERLKMPLLVNRTEYSIAWLYFLRGRFHDSLRMFAKAQATARQAGDAVVEALCDLDQAEVYLQLNCYEDALEAARLAAEKFSRLSMTYEYAKAKMYLGIAHTHRGDLVAAQQELEEARRTFQLERNDVYCALSDIYLSDVLRHQQQWDHAEQVCTEALRLFGRQNLPTKSAYAELQLARLRFFLGDDEGSEALCMSALERIGEAEAPWLRYQCLHLLGNLKQRAGQHQEAYEYYRQAVTHLEALQSSIRVDEYKSAFLADKVRVYEDLIGLCLRQGEAKIEEAFVYMQAAKSRSLVELLATERRIPSKVADPAVAELHQEWLRVREELDWYYSRANHSEARGHQRPVWLAAELRTEIRAREQLLARLTRRLRVADSEYASLHAALSGNTHDVRQHLAEDEVLIEYFAIGGRVTAFALSREEVRVFSDLTEIADVMALLRWLKFYLDHFVLSERHARAHLASVHEPTRHYLRKLYDALVRPLESVLEGKKIIVAPQGLLHYVPFHALDDGCQYVIDRQEVSYCPSASVYRLCVEKARRQPPGNEVLIVGVPNEATPLIEEEIAAVRSLWPEARVLLGEEATLDRLTQVVGECQLLHLASHGVFRRDNPMFSALRLADGWLNFYDIFRLNLKARLVTLSACETGLNEVFPGDELFGLMRGFLYAGAPSLIVSLWIVNDRSTADFMRQLYIGIKEGLSFRAALRQAQRAVKEQYAHPYYWAPFILMGAPSLSK